MQLADRPVRDAWQVLHETGLIGILIAILIGGWKRWWIFGWQHREVIEMLTKHFDDDLERLSHERDDWKVMAMNTPRREVWDDNRRRAAQAARETKGSAS
jgi:hypothetical protein